jgi:DnaJ family protein C protein 11
MDPYEFTQSVHENVEHEINDDELEQLEKDLAPSSADYYGILNISKKVAFV